MVLEENPSPEASTVAALPSNNDEAHSLHITQQEEAAIKQAALEKAKKKEDALKAKKDDDEESAAREKSKAGEPKEKTKPVVINPFEFFIEK